MSKHRSGKKKRRKKGKNHTPSIVAGVIALCLLAAIAVAYRFYVERGARNAYAKKWETADQQFGRRALTTAARSYQLVSETDAADAGIESPESVNELAQLMFKLSDGLENETLPAVADCLKSLREAPELEFVPQEMTVLSREQRIAEVTRWATERTTKVTADLRSQTTVPHLETLNSANRFAGQWNAESVSDARASASRWLTAADSLGVESGPLRQAMQNATTSENFLRELKSLLEMCSRALRDLQEPDLASAMYQWESIDRGFPQLISKRLWSDYGNQLRGAMRRQISGQPTSTTALQLPGQRLSAGPSRPDITGFVGLPDPLGARDPELVFARSHELCFALDADTGSAQWVIETGYDSRWLPQVVTHDKKRLVVCVWKHEKQDAVSILDSSDAEHRWTLALPPSTLLAGPPVVFKSTVHVLLDSGELWAFDISDGNPIACLKFPETTSSPMAVREDGRGAMVMGDKLGIYLVDLSGRPKIQDVVFPPKTPNTLSSLGMWIPPFAVVFQNELTDECEMLVFRLMNEQYTQVQTTTLPGRVWDSPAVVGADFLVVTDAVNESIQHVDVEAPIDPVSTRFQRLTRVDYPQRPYFISHHEAPFISMQRSTVVCYRYDPLSSGRDRKPTMRWEHEFPDSTFTPVQPLQITGTHLIVAAQSPNRRSVLVRSLGLESGDAEWSVELGAAITQVVHHGRSAVLRTDAGQLVLLSDVGENRWRRRILDLPRTDDRFDWVAAASAIVRFADSPPRIQVVDYSGSVVSERPISSPPAGPIRVRAGEIAFANDEEKKLNGVWCAYVDAKQRFHLIPLGKNAQQQNIVYHQLDDVPVDGWMRPTWLGQNAILAAHPQGRLVRVDLHRNGDVNFLERTDRLDELLSPLAAPPIDTANAIWVATRDSHVLRLNRSSLLPEASIKLPAAPSTEISVIDDHLLIGLRDGNVAVISTTKKPKLLGVNRISTTELQLSSETSKGILMMDDDRTVHLINADGKSAGRVSGSPPVSVAPIQWAGRLYIATTNGMWRELINRKKTISEVAP